MFNSYGRILCVDDDPKTCETIVTSLEDSGFIAYEANSKKEALDIFRSKNPDLVLCDIQMHSKAGLELIEILKEESPETPVIVISGSNIMSEIISALRLGAWDYIPKPITNLAVLEHAVCRALERGRLMVENKKYRMELEEKNVQLRQSLSQLEEDQNAAKSVQQKLLPAPLIQYQDYTLSHKIIPSLYLSGDFVDYFTICANKIGFYIADVSGHGASSAFVTVMIKRIVEQILENYKLDRDESILHPEKMLKLINDDICDAKLGKYLTMIYCILDLKENRLIYSVGGHYPNPIIWDGKTAKFLPGTGYAVGVYKPAQFESFNCDLPAQFTMAMFSDGIFEIMRGKNLEENEQTLLDLFSQTHLNVEEILTPLGVKKENKFPDDIALFLMNRKKSWSKHHK